MNASLGLTEKKKLKNKLMIFFLKNKKIIRYADYRYAVTVLRLLLTLVSSIIFDRTIGVRLVYGFDYRTLDSMHSYLVTMI